MTDLFYKLPQAITARKDLPASCKVLYAVILNYIGRNGTAWPGLRTLQNKTGLCKDTLEKSIKRLEQGGIIEVKRQGRGRCNIYKSVLKSRTPQKPECPEKQDSSVPKSRTEVSRKAGQIRIDPIKEQENFSFSTFVDFWNSKGLPKVFKQTKTRQSKFNARVKEPTFAENWQAIIDMVANSEFLTGKNDRNWKADVDWILKNDLNYTKVLEGKYANRQTPQASGKARPFTPEQEQAILDQISYRQVSEEELQEILADA